MAYVTYATPRRLPPLGPPSVGFAGLGATAPPVLHDIYWTMGYTRAMTETQAAAFRMCVNAKRASLKTAASKEVLADCQRIVMSGSAPIPPPPMPDSPMVIAPNEAAMNPEVASTNRTTWLIAGAAALAIGWLVLRK